MEELDVREIVKQYIAYIDLGNGSQYRVDARIWRYVGESECSYEVYLA